MNTATPGTRNAIRTSLNRLWLQPLVHTDPDGGDYGGHFLIYGRGDDDATWGRMRLVGPVAPIERKTRS